MQMQHPAPLDLAATDAARAYRALYADDAAWIAAWDARLARIAAGPLSARMKALVLAAGLLVAGDRAAAREYAGLARAAGASESDLRLLPRILEFYRGLKLFQDAQRVVTFWQEGHFPHLVEEEAGESAAILAGIENARGYLANGFRVYAVDGAWLKAYVARSAANRAYAQTLAFADVQLLSFAITLANHGFSGNFNDGCITVHERLARQTHDDRAIVEVLQLLEVSLALATAREAAFFLG